MQKKKKLPIGIQTFKKIVENNYLYIDKTKDIYKLLNGDYYFFSRPRRFGKSLLLSTLEEIFLGNRDLFKNLWIYDKIEWEQYPIIYIDFSKISYETPKIFKNELCIFLEKLSNKYKINFDKRRNYDSAFENLIENLSKNKKVVILIDEYDKPIIDFIEKPKQALKNREILRKFYSVIKGNDKNIKFTFITGISKFSKVSIFSGLNNLNDITIDNSFSTIAGITQEELELYFKDRIKDLQDEYHENKEEMLKDVKNWYNGYSWDGKNFLYNPFSILNLFYKKSFDNFWFATGTPTFLTKLLKKKNIEIKEYENYTINKTSFDTYEIDKLEEIPLLFQTGYLTIKKVKIINKRKEFTLGFPNIEVKESFFRYLLREYTEQDLSEGDNILSDLVKQIEQNNIEDFIDTIKSLFASIPYNIIENKESYYHSIFYLIFSLLGYRISCEVQTNKGRIDAVIDTEKNTYIFEFKMGTALEAMNQIKTMKYYVKYQNNKKKIILIGVGFDIKERNIKGYLIDTNI